MPISLVRSLFLALGTTVLLLAPNAEAKLLRWSCTYPIVANPNGAFRHQEYSVEFTFDNATGKASVIRESGSNGAALFTGIDSLTFLEKLDADTVRTTTIDKSGASVHSRHVILGGKLVPSQSYGRCAAMTSD
jgi:hypothetical protein